MIKLKFYREKQGFSQQQLAMRVNVTYQAVHKWETGEAYPSADKLPAIADALHCTIDALFGREKAE